MFERVIDNVLQTNPEVIIVAAAGNRSLQLVDFPARFSNVVAVGAIDSLKHVASYSNTGAIDQSGSPHSRLYFAPGGGNGEFVGNTITAAGKKTDHEGTSFAAPYVSALAAIHLEAGGGARPTANATLAHFQNHADTTINGYNASTHGNGLIRL
ncbi:MAG: S8 family serine peptidase [Mycolicibacterium sp.]|nr:S8 family serine peptidase [Mycolicibacterium sp.]